MKTKNKTILPSIITKFTISFLLIDIDGWGCWGDWSPCSVSCGSGRIERRRPCLAPGGCKGDSVQTTLCDGPPCSS